MFCSERELVSHLRSGNDVPVVYNGEDGVLCIRDGEIMLEVNPMHNGRSPVYMFALGSSRIGFNNLKIKVDNEEI